MAYTDVINKVSQNQQNNLDLILTKLRQGDGGSPYTAPPKEDPDRKYVPAPKKAELLPYQDGRVPNHLHYNNPYPGGKPSMFIIDQQEKEDARKRFRLFTGIDLAKGNQSKNIAMDDPLSDYDLTEYGLYMNNMGDMYMNLDGMLFPMGQGYDEGTHGKLVPKGLVQSNQSMKINPLIANFPYDFEGGVVTPRYFTPPRYRNLPFLHMRTKDIKDEELFHFNNFIKSMGGGLDTVRRQTPLSIG